MVRNQLHRLDDYCGSPANRLLLAVTVLLLFCGCSENSGKSDDGDSLRQVFTSQRTPGSGGAEDSAGGEPSSDTGSRVQSVYTDLDLDDCEVLRTFEEGTGVELRCSGYRENDLFVSEGDLRFDVDVGVPNDTWTSQSAFNTLGEKVEWRLRDGVPFAVIIRYYLDDGSGAEPSSVLAVLTVGREGSPGCLVGWVSADATPSQNEAARNLADTYAADFDCSASNDRGRE